MITMDYLVNMAKINHVPASTKKVLIEIHSNDDVTKVLTVLTRYFEEDNEQQEVQLKLDGVAVGHIVRSDICRTERCFSDSEFAQLPGRPSFKAILFRCPHEYCLNHAITMYPGRRPKCEDHDLEMVPVDESR